MDLKATLRTPELRSLRIWLLYRDRKRLERGEHEKVAATVTRRVRISLVVACLAGGMFISQAIALWDGGRGAVFLIYAATFIGLAVAEYRRVRRALRTLLSRREP
jgi:hypothetical protein